MQSLSSMITCRQRPSTSVSRSADSEEGTWERVAERPDGQ